MTARILVVDDVDINVRLLEAKLTLEYYDVMSCNDGATALEIAASERPDIILLDVMMPGMDGREDKIRGLDAGADDFVTKPIDDVVLFARVRSLVRLKAVMDELREREESGRRMGVDTDGAGRLRGSGGRVLIVDDNEGQAKRIADQLAADHRPVIEQTARAWSRRWSWG